MAEQKKKAVRYTTPAGTAQYPRILGEPDTKFRPEGVWSIKVVFPLADAKVAEMLERFEGAIAQAKTEAKANTDYMAGLKKRKKTLSEADRSYIVDEDAGTVTVNFKMTASGTSKKTGKDWERKPAVFDKKGDPMDEKARVGGGSTVKVSYTFDPFYTAVGYGCSIRLEAVQVLKLVEWGSGTANQYGFENEAEDEDGEDTETTDGADTETEDSDDEAADNDDF